MRLRPNAAVENAVRRIRAAIRRERSLETDTRSDFSSGDFFMLDCN
jgi:hypothetical protein